MDGLTLDGIYKLMYTGMWCTSPHNTSKEQETTLVWDHLGLVWVLCTDWAMLLHVSLFILLLGHLTACMQPMHCLATPDTWQVCHGHWQHLPEPKVPKCALVQKDPEHDRDPKLAMPGHSAPSCAKWGAMHLSPSQMQCANP